MKQISFINSRRRVVSEGFPEFSVGGGGGGHPKTRAGRSSQSLAASSLELGAGVKRVLTVSHWLSAGTSSGWRVVGLFLMASSLSLIMSCGGGSGGGGTTGDNSNTSVDDSSENIRSSPEVRWSIVPFVGGLSIEWSNLDSFNATSIFINITERDLPGIVYSINITITDFVDGIYNLTSLEDGTALKDGVAYRFDSLVLKYSDNSTRTLEITWWGVNGENNRADNNAGGIVVGEDHDRDGRAISVDTDNDDDDRSDDEDLCPLGEVGWDSNDKRMDNDEDGCRDDGEQNNGLGEDIDDDNDRLLDNHSTELLTNTDGVRCSLLADCDEDTLFDNHTIEQLVNNEGRSCSLLDDCDGDRVLDGDEEASCVLDSDCDNDSVLDSDELVGCGLDPDCDGDRVLDGNEVMGCVLNRDCDNDTHIDSMDVDDDGDGLIEIRNASELNAVRYQLNGNGSRRSDGGVLNTLGCGNGTDAGDISRCSGYELVTDISLTDYITEQSATAGWRPIAPDGDITTTDCEGDTFTGVFDGNGFIISGLFINRSGETCVGLFGQATGTIRHLGVEVSRVIGKGAVGGLVGYGKDAELIQSWTVNKRVRATAGSSGGLIGGAFRVKITQSYAVSGSVSGHDFVGGLIGYGDDSTSIIHSYAVSKIVRGNWGVGGLIGYSIGNTIVQSYAVNGIVKGSLSTGGLVGSTESSTLIVQTYAVSDQVDGSNEVGGLVGYSSSGIEIVQTYAVSGAITGTGSIGGLLGNLEGSAEVRSSYWDNETSGRSNDGTTGSVGQTSMILRSPRDYGDEGIYSTWDDGIMAEGIDDQSTIWCDEDLSETIEADEMRDNNYVWDFGTSSDYPALRCTGSLADQRAWWYLNTTSHKPQLNQDRLDAWLDGSLP